MRNEDFYHRFRKTIIARFSKGKSESLWVKYLLLAPDFFYLLMGLTNDARVGKKSKAMIGIVLAYFIMPFDLIPDPLISIGYLDDIVAAAYLIRSLLVSVPPEILNEYWAPRRDVTEVVGDICRASDKMIGRDLVRKLSGMFNA